MYRCMNSLCIHKFTKKTANIIIIYTFAKLKLSLQIFLNKKYTMVKCIFMSEYLKKKHLEIRALLKNM